MRRSAWSLLRSIPFTFATAGVCSACTLLLDLNTSQCKVDGDCRALQGASALVCAAGSCVEKRAETIVPDAGPDAPPMCTSNAECSAANFDEPYLCDKATGKCIAVKSDTCRFVLPKDELKNDNAVLVGVFTPQTGSQAALEEPYALAYQLALDEFKAAAGLPGGAGSPRRPLTAVFCDSVPQSVESGVKHLTQTLKVPAVVASFDTTNLTRLVQDYFVPSGTFVLNPSELSESLKSVNTNQLVWNLLGPADDLAPTYRPLVERIETYLKSTAGVTETHLAVVTTDSATEKAISSILRNPTSELGLRFNGKTIADNVASNASSYKSIIIPSFEQDPNATFGAVVSELAAFKPDILVLLAAEESKKIIEPLERALGGAPDGGAPPAGLPTYVLGPRNAAPGSELTAYIDSPAAYAAGKRKRFFGVQYAAAADQTEHQKSLIRFGDKFQGVEAARYQSIENFYDALYWVGYGYFAAGPGAPLKGSSFAEGVRKLLDGPEILTGDDKTLAKAFNDISNNPSTTFLGTLGEPSFDKTSGAAKSLGSVYCYGRTPTSVTKVTYDALRYDPATKSLTGTFPCFTGF